MKTYVFIGMVGGIIDEVKTYTNEKEAITAWEKYTAADWEKFKTSKYDNSYICANFEGSNIYESEIAWFCFDPTRQIANIWDIDDVKSIRGDLTDEQAMEVLEISKSNMDASIGINWDVLESWAEILYPNPDYNENDYSEF